MRNSVDNTSMVAHGLIAVRNLLGVRIEQLLYEGALQIKSQIANEARNAESVIIILYPLSKPE